MAPVFNLFAAGQQRVLVPYQEDGPRHVYRAFIRAGDAGGGHSFIGRRALRRATGVGRLQRGDPLRRRHRHHTDDEHLQVHVDSHPGPTQPLAGTLGVGGPKARDIQCFQKRTDRSAE